MTSELRIGESGKETEGESLEPDKIASGGVEIRQQHFQKLEGRRWEVNNLCRDHTSNRSNHHLHQTTLRQLLLICLRNRRAKPRISAVNPHIAFLTNTTQRRRRTITGLVADAVTECHILYCYLPNGAFQEQLFQLLKLLITTQ